MKNFVLFYLLTAIVMTIAAEVNDKQQFRVMFYNVENYFDCVDDPLTKDEEYLPSGFRAWNYSRYVQKQANIAKVIAAIGEWTPPALVGMCEVESRKALIDLTRYGNLKNLGYAFVHHESPDIRGIDVTLLYQPDVFKVLDEKPIRIIFPDAPASTTRDLLYVHGLVPSGDSLHVFVCHLPSRLGGEMASTHKRNHVANMLKQHIDSIFLKAKNANILIMGDFNDYPDNESMKLVLQARFPMPPFQSSGLYNLMYPLHKEGRGTHKHEGNWGALDQMIVSGNLLLNQTRLYTTTGAIRIFDADFLSEWDEKYLSNKPFRTYVGMKYNAGFSDHYPVYIDFWYP